MNIANGAEMPEKRGKVLIVDDELLSVETLLYMLSSEYETFTARNGREALELAESERPDVILLDILMPDMDGYEVIIQLHDNPELSDIPVLFITSMAEEECEAKGLKLGAHDYLTKPFNPSIVRLRVENHLRFKLRNDLIKEQRNQLSVKNKELETALTRIIQLEGIITICMYCKQIKNDSNSWEQLEKYITEHSTALFSHGICPDCAKTRLPYVAEDSGRE